MSRTIAIGDIHGCSEELIELLDKLAVSDQDLLIFLGDLINRGPNSRGVLDIVHEIKNKVLIMGNHELRLLKYHQTGDDSKLKGYDRETLECFNERDWDLLNSMKPTYYAEAFDTVFVHGGFVPSIPWYEQDVDVVARVQVIDKEGKGRRRSKCPKCPRWSDLWHGPPFVVYGHTPNPEIQRSTWTLCLDTACVWGGSLSAYILPEKEIIQVPAKKAYITKKPS